MKCEKCGEENDGKQICAKCNEAAHLAAVEKFVARMAAIDYADECAKRAISRR